MFAARNASRRVLKSELVARGPAVARVHTKAGSSKSRKMRLLVAAGAAVAVGSGILISTAECSGGGVHPANYKWPQDGLFKTIDASSIRRGHQVFQQVCSSCHSLDRIAFRNLVGVCYTEDEAKALASAVEIEDGPDEKGNMFMRPGKLSDYFPRPYKNENAARAANGGGYPPDLSVIVKARKGGENYVFSLLCGYPEEPPAGVNLREGLHYNPYFPGGAIAMAQALFDGSVEYEDGTPATQSQMAKDVTSFLHWAAEPEMEDRKRKGLKYLTFMGLLGIGCFYIKRKKWTTLKTRQYTFIPPSKLRHIPKY